MTPKDKLDRLLQLKANGSGSDGSLCSNEIDEFFKLKSEIIDLLDECRNCGAKII